MRKLLLLNALWAVLFAAVSVEVAAAGVNGPNEYDGHGYGSCEPATHLAYYDPRRDGQTIYNTDHPNGDNVFYVDTNPLAGFKPDGSYVPGSTDNNCDGTPVLRATAYFAVTFHDQDGTIRRGYPWCPRSWGDGRNPSCRDKNTGASGAAYVGTGDGSHGAGRSVGVTPFVDE